MQPGVLANRTGQARSGKHVRVRAHTQSRFLFSVDSFTSLDQNNTHTATMLVLLINGLMHLKLLYVTWKTLKNIEEVLSQCYN